MAPACGFRAAGRVAGGVERSVQDVARVITPLRPGTGANASNLRRCLAIALAFAVLLGASRASAHAVAVDGSAGEWFAAPSSFVDLGRVARQPGLAGEYVWTDAAGDERPAWPARPLDLRELRVTGDPGFLYVMAKLGAPCATAGDSVPQLVLALDTDRFADSGGRGLGDSSGLEIASAGAYERLLLTRFGSGRAPRVLDAWGGDVPCVAKAVLSPDGTLEIAVPWSALGFSFVPGGPLRVGAALFLTGADDLPLDPGDGVVGRAADVVTHYGAPGHPGDTATELADGILDHTFDVWFGGQGEVLSPVVVNEVFRGSGPESRWIEIANPTQAVVSLARFKLGDRPDPEGGALAEFPSGLLLQPGQVFVVARDGGTFFAERGWRADAECVSSDPSTRDMTLLPAWSTPGGGQIPAGADEVLLFDASNTVVDVVTYGTGEWPGVGSHPGAGEGRSLERANPARDTDDCALDFAVAETPSPGLAAQVAGVRGSAPAALMAWAPPAPNPARGRVALAIRRTGDGELRVDVLDAAGRRVRELHRGAAPAGETRMDWDTRDDGGAPVPAGVYFVRAQSRDGRAIARVAVVR